MIKLKQVTGKQGFRQSKNMNASFFLIFKNVITLQIPQFTLQILYKYHSLITHKIGKDAYKIAHGLT